MLPVLTNVIPKNSITQVSASQVSKYIFNTPTILTTQGDFEHENSTLPKNLATHTHTHAKKKKKHAKIKNTPHFSLPYRFEGQVDLDSDSKLTFYHSWKEHQRVIRQVLLCLEEPGQLLVTPKLDIQPDIM